MSFANLIWSDSTFTSTTLINRFGYTIPGQIKNFVDTVALIFGFVGIFAPYKWSE